MSRTALVLLLALVLSASESQALTRRSCHHLCKRFAAKCEGAASLSGHCQWTILPRLDVCRKRFADLMCGLPSSEHFPATGQTTCWDTAGSVIPCAGTGQDGEAQAGAALAYADNGDGTITDETTGLMWEKLSDDGGIHDKDRTYTWDSAFSVKVAALNSERFAGYTDWRLPNYKELISIINLENLNPAVSAPFNTSCTEGCTVTTCSCTVTDGYWSSSTYAGFPLLAWFVIFTDGAVGAPNKVDDYYVRAVRGGS
jgi:hypothetical protein